MRVVVEGNKRPVCHDATNALAIGDGVGAHDEILDSSCVEHDHIWHGKYLAQKCRSEERSVLDDDKVLLVIKRNTELRKEPVCRLAYDLLRELASYAKDRCMAMLTIGVIS